MDEIKCYARFRVIPNGIVKRGDKRKLRLVLAPMPSPITGAPSEPGLAEQLTLADWPRDFNTRILHNIHLYYKEKLGDAPKPFTMPPPEKWSAARTKVCQTLWRDLLAPDLDAYAPINDGVDMVRLPQPKPDKDAPPQDQADYDEIMAAQATLDKMHTDPWYLVKKMLIASQGAQTKARTQDAGKPLSLITPPRAAMARVVELIHATRLIDASQAAARAFGKLRGAAQGGAIPQLAQLPDHDRRDTLHWTGTVDMMVAKLKDRPKPGDARIQANAATAGFADAIVRRGAPYPSQASDDQKHGELPHRGAGKLSAPVFTPATPFPSPTLAKAVSDALNHSDLVASTAAERAARLNDRVNAVATGQAPASPTSPPATQKSGNNPSSGAETLHLGDIDQCFADLFAGTPAPTNPLNLAQDLARAGQRIEQFFTGAPSTPTPADVAAGVIQAAHAYHLIATVPEQRSDIAHIAQSINQAVNRRFFGIMNYPGLARLLRLAIDIEVDLPEDLSKADKVYVGACFNKGQTSKTTPTIWTACELDRAKIGDTAFTPLAKANDREDGAQDAAPETPVPQSRGLIVLGEKLTDQPLQPNRFTLSNVEQNLAFEQILNAAKNQGEKDKSSSVEPDSGVGTMRSSGISIFDAARGDQLQQQHVTGQDIAGKLASNGQITLYAEDLQIGFALDVCVESRTGGVWGSLVERSVTLGEHKGIDVHKIAQEALTSTAAPLDDSEKLDAAADRLIRTVSAAVLRPPARITTKGAAGDGTAIAQQTIGTWAGVPMGETAPGSEMVRDKHGAYRRRQIERTHTIAAVMDLPLSVATDLRRDSPIAPPRFEIGRSYYFGARAVYFGGVVVSLESAIERYSKKSGCFTVPEYTAQAITPGNVKIDLSDDYLAELARKRAGNGFVARRVERIGAPAISIAWTGARPGDERNEAQDTAIVRSDDGHRKAYETPIARRVIFARSVAQAFAIQHPSYQARNARLLDDAPVGAHGPLGGLANVRLSVTGGMPFYVLEKGKWIERKESTFPEAGKTPKPLASAFFRIEPTPRDAVLQRPAPFYPDPAAHKTVIQIRTRDAHPIALDTIVVDNYDDGFWQDQTDAAPVRCRYPHLMPVLLEVIPMDRSRDGKEPLRILQHSPDRDTGFADHAMRFTPWRDHGSKIAPPRGQVTMRRVQVRLEPGEDYDVVIWSAPRRHALHNWFAIVQAAKDILVKVGKSKGQNDGKTPLEALDDLLTNPASAWPVPEICEVTGARFCHATAIPPAPAILAAGKKDTVKCNTDASACGHAALWLVRAGSVSNDAWKTYFEANQADINQSRTCGDELTFHAHYATDAWFGGVLHIDQSQTGAIAVQAWFRDIQDLPGTKLPRVNSRGQPQFEVKSRRLWSEDISPEPMAKPQRTFARWRRRGQTNRDIMDAAYHGIVNAAQVVTPTNGTAGRQLRNLHLRFEDTRARVLVVRAIATSRFVSMMNRPNEVIPDRTKPSETTRFDRIGDPVTIILPSTAQPAPMPDVELIQAFTWTYETNGARRENVLRLQWRRPKHKDAQGAQASGCWYSSGEDEQVAIILPKDPGDTKNVSYWARDPQRTSKIDLGPRRPVSAIFGAKREADLPMRWMPLPQQTDDPGDPQAAGPNTQALPDPAQEIGFKEVRFLAFSPTYDAAEDLWRVDLPIDTGNTPGPYIELSLARFQPHAAKRRMPESKPDRPTYSNHDGDAARAGKTGETPWDYALSTPRMLGVRIQPPRRVSAVAVRLTDKRWAIDVRIAGPVSNIPISASSTQDLAPKFEVKLLRERGDAAADDTLPRHDQEVPFTPDALPKGGDDIFTQRLILGHGQGWRGLRVYVDEREQRLSALVNDHGGYDGIVDAVTGSPERLVLTGVLFAASVPVRRQAKPRQP